ncbi:endolytic transglycosylase MltG [Spiractinospora alimapuensis]|uniref:endolytic transglycosylase MltG n=1 Tax=Spiractinospora alimapuensis TaxID=2820884 RepID=UPI001F2B2BC2|nr:endolytic transglycosylase MltG [Spiractinospora alimapuensis]QVQ52068.1 endolytic transglycosylase MltG [Spiractinospora alimapuensis]
MNGAGHGDREYRGTRRRTEPTPEIDPAAAPEWEQFRPRGRRHKPPTDEREAVTPPPPAPAAAEPRAARAGQRRRAPDPESVFTPPRRGGPAPTPDQGFESAPPEPPQPSVPDVPEPPPYALPADGPAQEPERHREEAQLASLGFDGEDDGGDERSGRRRPKDRSSSRKRKGGKARPRRRVFPQVLALVILLVFVVGGGGVAVMWMRGYFAPPDFEGDGSGEAQVVIEPGQTGEQIGEMLVAEGVIASTRAFTNALRIEGVNDMRPGTYMLRQEMSAESAVGLLTDPAARIGFQVTIREGLRLTQILDEVHEATEVPLEEFEEIAEDPESFLEMPEYADARLDGYLFPDTYTFEPDVEAVEILQKMLDRYEAANEEIDFEGRAEERGYDPQEMMGIAAIAQAEAGSAEDMPKISQVVYNRLDANMELGMDSTCFFVINDYGIALTGEQLRECQQSGSEYATYGRDGLPAGPIVNPGLDAMNAALDPEVGEWLFFVTTDPENGITEFAETEAEFDELVRRFRETQEAE